MLIIEAKNSKQLNEAAILEVLQRDGSENSNMIDPDAEECPNKIANEEVVENGQADHSTMRNLVDFSVSNYMCWRMID